MAKKPRTPQELAKDTHKERYSLSLTKSKMDIILKWSAKYNEPYSNLVDEAILYYIEITEEKKN